MLNTKEFIEVMAQFEKDAKKTVSIGHAGFTKEPKDNWIKQNYYCDGNCNNAFKLYLLGFSLGKTY
jgi:hypothetical protein